MSADVRPEFEPGVALTRGSFQLLAGRGFFLIAGFLISAILSRVLGPIDFGVYGVVISVLTWCERVLSAGIPGATAVLIPRHDHERGNVEQCARILLALWSIPLFAGLWIAAPSIADYFGITNGATLIRITAVNLPAMSLFHATEGILGGRRKFKAEASMQVFQSGTKLVGVLLLLLIGATVSGALIAHVAAALVTVIVISFFFPPTLMLPSKAVLYSMLRLALPSGIYVIAFSGLVSMSLWQLTASPEGEGATIGYFVASLNLTRILQLIPAALGGVLFVSLSWATASGNRSLSTRYVLEAGRLSIGVLLPACVLLSVNASEVMALLFGREYGAGGDILRLLCLAFLCLALLDVWLNAISADGKFTVPAVVVVCLIPVLYVTNKLLIPWGGAIGAALASALVFALGVLIAAILTRKKFGALLNWLTVVRIGAAGCAIWIIGSVFPASGPWVLLSIAVLSIVYLLILWVTGEITKQDLALLPFVRAAKQ